MNKKIISFMLLSAIVTTGTLGMVKPIKASAVENNSSIVNRQTQKAKLIKPEEGKIYDINKVIKIIENKYLEQKSDGTLEIKSEASNEIGKESLDAMYKQIDFVNKKIENNELEFKLTQTLSGVKVETIKQDVIDSTSRSIGSNIFNNSLCTFSWYWWGFYANVNQTGSEKLQNEYTYVATKYGLAYGLLLLVPGGAIPASIGGAITELTIGDCIRICANGKIDNGVLVGALGAPSSPSIFHLSEN